MPIHHTYKGEKKVMKMIEFTMKGRYNKKDIQ